MCCGLCSSFGSCVRYSALLTLIIAILYGGIRLRLNSKEFIFDEKEVSAITKAALASTRGQPVKETLSLIEKRLREKHGDHILPKEHQKWIFVNCGGWMGAMYILHASMTEYVMFFGTGIDTSGHSGRYLAEITDTLVSGTMRQWKEGGMVVKEYGIGDYVHHAPGEVTGVQWTSGTIMVEYGRGVIPSTLLFALADTVFGTTDFVVFYETIKIYAISLGRELLQGNF
ncbi:PREDICTED: sigma non-opioid intracellular receptor 1-like [Amphimedon queenslandica]|uniref:Sigma non-opioid intracellular receptor 1 n=1 Tax=Amphimedon queenslandica TaxID=400682 RepID=A0A1X7V8V1_AMPQE|nr:PREDICTED: sigma non-opioid intracellular receptor 1-like [Amphimedon queenslandica]|eukprot:XP_003385318.1 PREDICTED: sigma non-opioid intracellular receptor 1-like [Amphimedon queenslandica]